MNDAKRMIIAKLRDRDVCSLAHNSCHNDWVCEEAADLIERQQTRIEELEALLLEARTELAVGVESEGTFEAEHSIAARGLVSRMDAALEQGESK